MAAAIVRIRFEHILALAGFVACALIAATASGLGDYPTDAGPALTSIAHGHLGSFFAHQPAMGAFALLVRVPFVAIGSVFGSSAVGLYRWGAAPCVFALGAVAFWLSVVARRRGASRLGQLVILVICLFSPLVGDALYWGHPEEILTAALAAGALLAACEGRVTLTAVLAGLAIASKQWAVLILLPAVLIVGRQRLRLTIASLGVATTVTLPMVVANFGAFRHMLAYISKPQPIMTVFTWLYPFSPTTTVHVTNIFGDSRSFIGRGVFGLEATLSHPLIVALGLLVPALLWWRGRGSVGTQQLLGAAALVLLLRCVLDPGSAAYYHLAMILVLVTMDATAGRRLPTAGICGTAIGYLVFVVSVRELGSQELNLVYVAATVLAAGLLVRQLSSARSREPSSETAMGAAAEALMNRVQPPITTL